MSSFLFLKTSLKKIFYFWVTLVIFRIASVALFSSLLSLVLLLVGIAASKKIEFNLTYISPFECGFTPLETSKVIFSSRFFVMALVFLIFDVELILIFPYICINQIVNYAPFFMLLFFINILSFGLYYEWNFSIIDWIY